MKSKLIQTIFLANLLVMAASAQDTNAPVATNAPAVAPSAPVVPTAPAVTDYRSFELITKRNIFDPTRRVGRAPTPYVRPPRVDSFTLVGTMSYEKGQFAFFDGSSSEFRKTLKPSDKIAGYKIAEIAPDHIVLAAASNQTINLPVGTRMRRQEGGAWKKTGGAEAEAAPTPSAASPSDAAASAAVMSGGESDAMKRLMLKRLSEK
jgi:hypothetical protein